MTDPIIDRLDQIKGRADKATEGPWDLQPWSRFALPSGDYAESILLANASPDGELVRGLLDEDGEFIAAARTDVPALVDALIRVLDRCDRAISFPTPDGEMRQACIAMRETAEIIRDEIAVALADETEGEGR